MDRLRRFLILFIIAVLVAISGVLMPRTVHADYGQPADDPDGDD